MLMEQLQNLNKSPNLLVQSEAKIMHDGGDLNKVGGHVDKQAFHVALLTQSARERAGPAFPHVTLTPTPPEQATGTRAPRHLSPTAAVNGRGTDSCVRVVIKGAHKTKRPDVR